ncbi:MAG: hypothetical protein IJ132_05845 [Firmicutes bacterium]|nr:hypothetical protein [Bacillota bacterium]
MENKPRAKMPISQRAKQFMPFDAVSGLREALREKDREHEMLLEMDRVPFEEDDIPEGEFTENE